MTDRRYYTNIKLEILGADLIIEDADISLDYMKTSEKDTRNTCEIIIYNLSDDTYNRINTKANSVRAYVDIDGQGYALVFAGDLRQLKKYKKSQSTSSSKIRKSRKVKKAVTHYNEPPIRRESDGCDIQTIINLEDGMKSTYFNNYISRSYKKGITNKAVLDDVLRYVKSKSQDIKISADLDNLKEYTYSNGLVLQGGLKQVINQVCSTGEASCTVQDDVILITANTPSKENVAYTYVLDGDICPTPEANADKEYDIQAPFIPNINPTNWVQLHFRDYDGVFQVKKIKSKIDNFGSDNETMVTVRADNL